MKNSSLDSIERYLRENAPRFINELCEYLRFPSVSAQKAHRPDMRACARWLLDHCRKIGLTARLFPTPGQPVLVATTRRGKARGKPHFVVYGHYDVQPPDPLDLWKSPPFEPRFQGRHLYARGAADNKGQHFAHLKAVEAYLNTGVPLPCDLTFVIEGEEEVGSESLSGFLKKHRAELRCEAMVVSDTGMPSLKHPALTYALRGVQAFEVRLEGPSRDLHSGIYGGLVDNPAMVLCQMLGALRDSRGRIRVPGFYDKVRSLTPYERRQLKRLPHTAESYRKLLGVPKLFGERGFSPVEQCSARPTLEINGLTSGYQGEGSKTIIPAWASAKITCRLVPDQTTAEIARLLQKHLERVCPPTVRLKVEVGHGGEPYLVSPKSPLAKAALEALRQSFQCEPVLLREGGSIPIVNEFKRQLEADTLLLGLALPDANAHSPNERFHLDAFAKGMRLSAALWQLLPKAVGQ